MLLEYGMVRTAAGMPRTASLRLFEPSESSPVSARAVLAFEWTEAGFGWQTSQGLWGLVRPGLLVKQSAYGVVWKRSKHPMFFSVHDRRRA
jgi:hypothetical protein